VRAAGATVRGRDCRQGALRGTFQRRRRARRASVASDPSRRYGRGRARRLAVPATGPGVRMGDGGNGEVIDEGFFRRYRNLLDAGDAAFDELEHAYEEGDGARFGGDLAAWREVGERRMGYLERRGLGPLGTPT